jgi:ribosomal 30S subunit maturation factor RimM
LDGLRVLDRSGAAIGVVTSLYSAGGHCAMEITRPDGTSVLVPVAAPVIASVDLERGEVVVNDIAPYAVEED